MTLTAEDKQILRHFVGTVSAYTDLIESMWDFEAGDITLNEYRDKDLRRFYELVIEDRDVPELVEICEWVESTPFWSRFWWSVVRGGTTVYRIPAADWDGPL